MSRYIYILDTETTTTNFHDPAYAGKPNGRVVELGIVCLDLDTLQVGGIGAWQFKDPEATGLEWVYTNTDLPFRRGCWNSREWTDNYLAGLLDGQYTTAFNWTFFDKIMLDRDLPQLSSSVVWIEDIMIAADRIDQIPRKLHDSSSGKAWWPSVQTTYNYLYPDEPMVERHRAYDDAWQEARILAKLIEMGIYEVPE